ncbi:MAG TPA: cation:dicarboxylase symporter family transporter, partial [Gemmatimonadaceae bacterium]|nr:cation:dicarboxylase symporter family transporter [Gemmatimonadaceae bacterium]
MKLQTKILAGLVAGVLVGVVARVPELGALQRVVLTLEPLGIMFIRLLTMTIVPLIVASLFVGVASLGDVRRLGRIGGKTLAWFFGSTLIASLIGLTAALAARLGGGLDAATRDALTTQFEQHGTAPAQFSAPTLAQTLIAMVPSNPFAAAAQGDLLPLIVAVCIFGAAATALHTDGKR